jgi:peptide-methionine (S)-S-oxide reductase
MATKHRHPWIAVLSGAALLAALAAGGLSFHLTRARAAELDRAVPPPALDQSTGVSGHETLILAGGCFWGIQGVFQHVRGVEQAVSGYDGSGASTAQYETVSTGITGSDFTEVVTDTTRSGVDDRPLPDQQRIGSFA